MWRFFSKFIFFVFILTSIFVFSRIFISDHSKNIDTIDANIFAQRESSMILNSNDSTFAELNKDLQDFLRREHLHGGASVAISYNGNLVYAQGIGNADDTSCIQPYNLFRIASVSKLITAIGAMKLVESGKIDLDQKIFGKDGVLNVDRYSTYRDERIENVTLRQLLNHSAGWTSRWGDPMFMPHTIANSQNLTLPIDISDIIKFMLGKRLHFQPGSGSSYSNFGFGILGEVIAEVSGMPYEKYIQTEILFPLGITDMQLGYSHINMRIKNEVAYYEEDTTFEVEDYADINRHVRRSYGGSDIHTLGSAGGWVASATDLLKILLAIDGFDNVPDLLNEKTLRTMVQTYDNKFDPIGWRGVDGETWFRTGTLAATSAILERRPDRICYVILLNSSNSRGPELATKMRKMMDNSLYKIKTWPSSYDLFDKDSCWTAYKLRYNLCK